MISRKVNDALGHQAGDEALVSVGTFLQSFSRGSDVVARVGGEEFVWLMPETTGSDAVRAVERARACTRADRGAHVLCRGV